jgi:hypothetical protein
MSDEVERVLALLHGPARGGDPFSGPELRALFELARRLTTPEEQSELVRELLPGLDVAEPFHAACVALTMGTLVEHGASPAVAGEAIAARLFRELGDPDVLPQTGQYLCLAAMAHLCRDVPLRQRVRRAHGVPACLEAVEDVIKHAWFVRLVLELTDELELLVLCPEQRRGYRVRADGVRTCFHLFTLLQGALIGDPAAGWLTSPSPDGPEDPEVYAVATGEAPHLKVRSASQRFHFHDWRALGRDGALVHDLRASISGQSAPSEIPVHDGLPVVLLGRPVLGGRSWDTNFFANVHDALRSSVTVLAQLSEAEVTAALAALAAAAPHAPE